MVFPFLFCNFPSQSVNSKITIFYIVKISRRLLQFHIYTQLTNTKPQTQFFTTVTLVQFCVSKSPPFNVTSLITVQPACNNTEVVNPFHPQSVRRFPINSSYPSQSPTVTHNIAISTVPIRHTVPLSHTIYSYQQSLSVTQSHCYTQYIPINSPYPSHSLTVTHNISLSTVPIRHTGPLSHTIYPYQQSLSVTQSHCHTQYIHSLSINSFHIALFTSTNLISQYFPSVIAVSQLRFQAHRYTLQLEFT